MVVFEFSNSSHSQGMVELSGIEPLTSCVQGRRSPSWAITPLIALHFALMLRLDSAFAQSCTSVHSFTLSSVDSPECKLFCAKSFSGYLILSQTRRFAAKHTWSMRVAKQRSMRRNLVGLSRLELPTSPLSGVRSNHLSYRPIMTWRSLTVCSISAINHLCGHYATAVRWW